MYLAANEADLALNRHPELVWQPETTRPPALAASKVSFTTTVPKELVHRAAHAEVLLTRWARQGDARFELTAQWPRTHSFFTPPSSTHHAPSLVAETFRQATCLLAHAEYGIPLGHHFIMNALSYDLSMDGVVVGDSPAEVGLSAQCSELRHRGRRVSGFRCDLVLHRDGRPAATGSARFDSVPPPVYRRLRGDGVNGEQRKLPLPAPVAPQYVGRTSPTDVVLAPTDEHRAWRLRVDTRHPTMFDHPVDHVPGMVLLEAACQAASACTYPDGFEAVSMSSVFHCYAEHDAPCVIAADHRRGDGTAPETVYVTGRQSDELIFETTLKAAVAS